MEEVPVPEKPSVTNFPHVCANIIVAYALSDKTIKGSFPAAFGVFYVAANFCHLIVCLSYVYPMFIVCLSCRQLIKMLFMFMSFE